MKKFGRIFLLIGIASAFLLSCGIPSYFYLESSDYSYLLTSSPDVDHTFFSYDFKVSDTEMLDRLEDGLGLVLFYSISTDDSAPTLTTFSSLYSTSFVGSDGLGVGGAFKAESEVPVIKASSYNLSSFFLSDGSSPSTPYYLRNMNSKALDETLLESIKLSLRQSESDYYVVLEDERAVHPEVILQRYSASASKPFTVDPSEIFDSNDENGDYKSVTALSAGKYYIHIYAAFTAQNGEFSNRYWSDLKYLGYLTINIPS
ncbi:MAG: hypothetical protein WCR70_03325 [Sphaerochaetaceae bacterium]